MEAKERKELCEFLEKMSRGLEERLTVSLAPVQREIQEFRGEMRDGFAQMNARMESIETVWRVVRDCGPAQQRLRTAQLTDRVTKIERRVDEQK